MTTVERDQHGRRYVQPDRPVLHAPAYVVPHYPATLPELLLLIAEIQAVGGDVGERVRRMQAVTETIDQAVPPLPTGYLEGSLLDLDPAELTRRVRDACTDVAITATDARRVTEEFRNSLADDVSHAIGDISDDIVTAMRPKFDKALAVVYNAAHVGLDSTSTAQTIVTDGNAKQLTAWRALPAAVADLDHVARARDQLTEHCHVGPRDWPTAAFLAPGATLADLQGAANRMRGETQIHHKQDGLIVTDIRGPVPRCGGAWLALAANGYQVRLNTGAEAHTLLERAVASQCEGAA